MRDSKMPVGWLGVQFFDLDKENPLQPSCVITSENQCTTDLERSAFRACLEVRDTVMMGMLCCKPVYTPKG